MQLTSIGRNRQQCTLTLLACLGWKRNNCVGRTFNRREWEKRGVRKKWGRVQVLLSTLWICWKITVEHQRMGEQLLFFLVLFLFQKNIFPPHFLRNHTFAFISKKKRQNRNLLKGCAFVYKTIENG